MQSERQGGYAPIGSYGLFGDGHGSALVSSDGSVDWLAVPRIDSAPLLAAIVDDPDGGRLLVAPAVDYEVRRRYVGESMVVETTFETGNGRLRVTDSLNQGFLGRLPWSELARRIEADGDAVPVRWLFQPGTRFATCRPWLHLRDGVPFALAGDLLAALILDGLGEPIVEDGLVRGDAVVRPGSPALLGLVAASEGPVRLPSPTDILRRQDHSIEQWEKWSGLIEYSGPHRAEVVRSALTIKAFQSVDSGALAASATTSLPERVGTARNFDYRFGWVRDSAFMIDALTRLHLSQEVDASLSWLLQGVRVTAPEVHVFYTLDGQPAGAEQHELGLMDGYKGSNPVMVGNKAAAQAQHGSYGDLFGAIARYVENGGRLDTETGLLVVKLSDQLCDEWTKPDAGLWELSDYQRYTSSLINAWSALDRAVTLVERGEVPAIHVDRWRLTKEAIHRFVDDRCWSESKSSYTFYAGTDDLDAAVLVAARTGFSAGDDPRLWSTIDAIRAELTAEGPLLYRYTGAGKQEDAFVACTFWLIEALAYAGRTQEAGGLLDGALGYANDLGLWSEEVDPADGALRGNFPIGISHLAVIGAITQYAAATSGSGGGS